MAWFVQLLVSVGLMILGYILAPKPPGPKPPELKDFDTPTADAGRPIPVVFGTVNVTGANALWYGDRSIRSRESNANSGGK